METDINKEVRKLEDKVAVNLTHNAYSVRKSFQIVLSYAISHKDQAVRFRLGYMARVKE